MSFESYCDANTVHFEVLLSRFFARTILISLCVSVWFCFFFNLKWFLFQFQFGHFDFIACAQNLRNKFSNRGIRRKKAATERDTAAARSMYEQIA